MELPDKSTVALIGVLIPAATWTISGLWALWVRKGELDAARWRRLGELARTLNRGQENGLWAQISSAHELAGFTGAQGAVALEILHHGQETWRQDRLASPKLLQAIEASIAKSKKRNKVTNAQGT